MSNPTSAGITQLLLRWKEGDEAALERLTPIIYDELRQLAHRYMLRERPGHVLQTTALIHEAYLRLVGLDVAWEGRSHFVAISAGLMRSVLVDYARRQGAAKRGGGDTPISLDDASASTSTSTDLLELNDALERLARIDPRKSRITELKYFGGLTIAETAVLLGISHATVERDLKLARAWLADALASAGGVLPSSQA